MEHDFYEGNVFVPVTLSGDVPPSVCSLCIKVSQTASMGCADVPDLVCVLPLKRKSSYCSSPSHFSLSLAVFLLSPAPSRLH